MNDGFEKDALEDLEIREYLNDDPSYTIRDSNTTPPAGPLRGNAEEATRLRTAGWEKREGATAHRAPRQPGWNGWRRRSGC